MINEDSVGIFEIEVSLLEIAKSGGLGTCREIFNVLDSLAIHRVEYKVCIVEFKKLLKISESLENNNCS